MVSSAMTPDFNRICRLCLIEEYSLVPIFDEGKLSRQTVPLSQQMMSIASLKLSSCDGLPNKICHSCLNQVHRSYEFKTLCERSDATLRQFIGRQMHQSVSTQTLQNVTASDVNLSQGATAPAGQYSNSKSDMEDMNQGELPKEEQPPNYAAFGVRHISSQDGLPHNVSSHQDSDKIHHHPGWQDESLKDPSGHNVGLHTLKSVPFSHENSPTPKWEFEERKPPTVQEFISNLHQFAHPVQNGERQSQFPANQEDQTQPSNSPHHGPSVLNNLKPSGLMKQADSFAGPVFVPTKRAQSGIKSVYYCDLCSKMYSSAGALWNHKLIHTGTKPHTCTVCNKQFYQLANLKYHEKTHGEKQWYTCQTCRKTLKTELGLKLHSLQHSGEKPYLCPYCNKPFTTLGVLEAHVRIHTGEKPYECSYCFKTFAQQGTLTCHIRRHTGEKPFSCKVCQKSFTQRANLNEHIKRYHPDQLEQKPNVHQMQVAMAEHHQQMSQLSGTPHPQQPTTPGPQQSSTPQLQQPPTPGLQQPATPQLQQPPTPQMPQPSTPQPHLQDHQLQGGSVSVPQVSQV
ncbi:zinc finger protein 583-like [Frankliniella occidentalis]|uniref:Zinc finger protein 583-like n=1 Tax=Frankliniella occidentalis TaxID=133901 RepID=A0A6J1RYP7_FRAOC|nr:zinc finger protein 583-like [Frankliniella occidentalis]